jgi:hypothetical protein
MGSILDMARNDIRKILNGGFSTDLTITPIGLTSIVVKGMATKHSQGFDSDGLPVIGDNAHCSFSELDVNDLGVATRDGNGNLNIKGWKVTFTDHISTYSYKFSETMPDNTVGLIRIMLSTI